MSSPYRLHYWSQDVDATTWSVYSELYVSVDHDQPIDGSTALVGTYPTEAAAEAEARRLQAPLVAPALTPALDRIAAGAEAARRAETAPAPRLPAGTLGGVGRQSQDRPEWRACR